VNVDGVGAENVLVPWTDGLAVDLSVWQLARGKVAERTIRSISSSAGFPAIFANDQRRLLIPFDLSWSVCKTSHRWSFCG
jgi:hypothetical protein